MSDPTLKIKVAEWVERARTDPIAYQQRQTVEITLNAIAMTTPLNVNMFLKGGILMVLAYNSPRQTFDIDLTTDLVSSSTDGQIDDACCKQILYAFIEKCRSRHLEPTRMSLDAPEIKKRAGTDWQTMKLEVGELPDFEDCFARVSEFYRNLPWDSK